MYSSKTVIMLFKGTYLLSFGVVLATTLYHKKGKYLFTSIHSEFPV